MKYKIKNISGQRIEFFSINSQGMPETDFMEIDEVVGGIKPFVVSELKFYEIHGLIKIQEDIQEIDWRKEGF